jgi:hypothetical protein
LLEFDGGAKQKVAGDADGKQKHKEPTCISFDPTKVFAFLHAEGKEKNDDKPDEAADENRSEIVT